MFESVSLEKLQTHIAEQNEELESRQTFFEKDIIVRMKYKYSADITIIDTPGTSDVDVLSLKVWV